MSQHPTLVLPPPVDEAKSPIENILELTELTAIGPVSKKSILKRHEVTDGPLGYLHQLEKAMAPSRRTRHIRWRCDRTMSVCRPTNRSGIVHDTLDALLLRSR